MPTSPLGPVAIVRANSVNRDPALDLDAMGAKDAYAYWETHEEALLKFVPGLEPVRFVVKPLSRMYLAEVIEPRGAMTRQLALAFLVCCHEIRIPGEPESMKPAADELRRSEEYGIQVASAAWLERVAGRYAMETVYEIGACALRRARLPDPTEASSG